MEDPLLWRIVAWCWLARRPSTLWKIVAWWVGVGVLEDLGGRCCCVVLALLVGIQRSTVALRYPESSTSTKLSPPDKS